MRMNEKRGGRGNHRKARSRTQSQSEPQVVSNPKSNQQAVRELRAAEKKRARLAKKGLTRESEKASKRARYPEAAQRGSARRAAEPLRRTRARWKPVSVLICLLAMAGLAGGLYYGTGLFHVREIEVAGCSRLDPNYIRALSGIDRETRFFGVNGGEVAKALKSEFWVESVSVKRKLPLKLVIQVKERQPWASVPMVGRLFSVDINGVVLEELPSADPALPMMLDLPYRAVAPGDSLQGEQFKTCVDLLLAMPVEVQGRFLSISSTPDQEVTMVTHEGMQVIYGTPSDEETKNKAIKALLQDPGVNLAELAYLDVSEPDHPVIKPR